jgi:hypothetical protein
MVMESHMSNLNSQVFSIQDLNNELERSLIEIKSSLLERFRSLNDK